MMDTHQNSDELCYMKHLISEVKSDIRNTIKIMTLQRDQEISCKAGAAIMNFTKYVEQITNAYTIQRAYLHDY